LVRSDYASREEAKVRNLAMPRNGKHNKKEKKQMHRKEIIQFALNVSNNAVLSIVDEMSDTPTTFPTSNGGCHPLWVLGHLTLIEGTIPQLLLGETNPVERWKEYFGGGTEPVADANKYPSLSEIRETYLRLRERNLKLLESLSEEELDRPTKTQPKGLESEFDTYGKSFMTLALHQMSHRSHLTDARRSAALIALAAAN